MPYLHDSGFAYLATPRTASRATARALEEVGFEKVGSHHGGLEHLQAKSVATTIRDPKSVLGSWVRRNKKPSMTPEEIVRQEILTNSWVWRGRVASWHTDEATTILRYEEGVQSQLNDWLPSHLQVKDMPQVGPQEQGAGSLTEGQMQIIKDYTRDERSKLRYI